MKETENISTRECTNQFLASFTQRALNHSKILGKTALYRSTMFWGTIKGSDFLLLDQSFTNSTSEMFLIGAFFVASSVVFLYCESAVVIGEIPELRQNRQILLCPRPNERFYPILPVSTPTCASIDQPLCANGGIWPTCTPPSTPPMSGCGCIVGFYRNGSTNTSPCVSRNQCPSN